MVFPCPMLLSTCYNEVMIFLDLIFWWYGPGWLRTVRRISERTQKVGKAFSIPTLLGTLFSPWRRIVSAGGKGLDGKLQALLDNLVSRAIGFVVRVMVLFTAVFMLAGSLLLGVAIVIIWPLIPVLFVYSLIKGAGA